MTKQTKITSVLVQVDCTEHCDLLMLGKAVQYVLDN